MGKDTEEPLSENENLMEEASMRPESKYAKPAVCFGSLATIIAIIALIVVLLTIAAENVPDVLPSDPLARAQRLMELTPLLDSHNDLPMQYRERVDNNISALDIRKNLSLIGLQTDIPRLRDGKLGAQIWSVFIGCDTPDPVQATMEQIDDVYRLTVAYPDTFQLVMNSDDIVPTFRDGKVASLMGMEGGHSINSSMGALRSFYYLGARYMTLTHTCSTPWAQSANDNSGDVIGLTEYGKQIVSEMNRIGMMVDISHVAVQTMYDALNTTTAPIIFSHSNTRALCNHVRNVPDDVLARLPQNGGVVMVVFYPAFVCQRFLDEQTRLQNQTGCGSTCVDNGLTEFQNGPNACGVPDVADHIDHIRKIAGIDHIGIGSDFDGINFVPVGLEDVSKYPNLIAELVRRNYTDSDIRKVLSGNVIRVLQQVEIQSRLLKTTDPVGP